MYQDNICDGVFYEVFILGDLLGEELDLHPLP